MARDYPMKNREHIAEVIFELPEVPESAIASNGDTVITKGNVWRMWDSGKHVNGINWTTFPEGSVKHGLQIYFHYVIGAYAVGSVYTNFSCIRRWLQASYPVELEELDINWWNDIRQKARETGSEERVVPLRAWYMWMSDIGIPGTDGEVALAIDGWRLRNAPKGTAVTRRDREHGPLNEEEFSVLTQALKRPQPVTLELIATSLCKELGSNPENLSLLEERDFSVFSDPKTGHKMYLLAMPRIKKRIAVRETKPRPISTATGTFIEKHLTDTRARFDHDDPRRPLLCRETPRQPKGVNAKPSWHSTSVDISRYVTSFSEKNLLSVSGSPDDAFRLTPRRLRYTIGTRLAQQGYNAAEIAEVLDHSDERTCQVYIDSDFATQAKRMTGTLDPELAPTVDLLMGRRAKLSDATVWPQIPGKVIGGELTGSIGLCGSGGLCKHMQGFSCYGCEYLHIYVDGPHEKVLEGAYRVKKLYSAQERATHGDMGFIDRAITGMRAAVALKANFQKPPPEGEGRGDQT